MSCQNQRSKEFEAIQFKLGHYNLADNGHGGFPEPRLAGLRAQADQLRNRTLSGAADEMFKSILAWTIGVIGV